MGTVDEHREWGNLRFRQRGHGLGAVPGADPVRFRFRVGLSVFVGVALLHPWYSYHVQAYLLARDLQAVGQALESEIQKVSEQAEADATRARQAQARRAQAQREAARRGRVARVKVMGATEGRGGPTVVVNLGEATVAEALGPICSQASRYLGRPVREESVRVQRYRGTQPALDAGPVRC